MFDILKSLSSEQAILYVNWTQAKSERDLNGLNDDSMEDVRDPQEELEADLSDQASNRCLFYMPCTALRSELQTQAIRKCVTMGSALDMEQRTKAKGLREKAAFLAEGVVRYLFLS